MKKIEVYYYKLDKSTGKVDKIILNAKQTLQNYDPKQTVYRFRHPCGNTAIVYENHFDKVSATGVWLVSFRNDIQAATTLFKEWWKDKAVEANKKLEDAMIWQSKCHALYEKIS